MNYNFFVQKKYKKLMHTALHIEKKVLFLQSETIA